MIDGSISFLEQRAAESGYEFATESAILPNGARVTRLNAAGPIVIYNFLYQDDDSKSGLLLLDGAKTVAPQIPGM